MIVRINGREEPKQGLQVCLGGEMLCLGRALRRLGGPESAKIRASGLPRRRDLFLGEAPRLGVGVSSRMQKLPYLAFFTEILLTKTNHFETKL